MLPYFSGKTYDDRYTANKLESGKLAYRSYIQNYFKATNNKPFDYDSYPFKFTQSNDCANDPTDSYIETNYFSNLQLVAEESKLANTDFYLTMQSHASTAGATVYADMDGAADTAENRKAVADAAAAINNTFAAHHPESTPGMADQFRDFITIFIYYTCFIILII